MTPRRRSGSSPGTCMAAWAATAFAIPTASRACSKPRNPTFAPCRKSTRARARSARSVLVFRRAVRLDDGVRANAHRAGRPLRPHRDEPLADRIARRGRSFGALARAAQGDLRRGVGAGRPHRRRRGASRPLAVRTAQAVRAVEGAHRDDPARPLIVLGDFNDFPGPRPRGAQPVPAVAADAFARRPIRRGCRCCRSTASGTATRSSSSRSQR